MSVVQKYDPALMRQAVTSIQIHSTVKQLVGFSALLAQLGLIIVVSMLFRIESSTFSIMLWLITAGFAIHYWLPLKYKEHFFVGVSLAGAYVLLDYVTATLVIALGGLIFCIVRSRYSFRIRVSAVLILTGVAAAFRVHGGDYLGIPSAVWPIAGSIFMFRLVIYLYDHYYSKEKPTALDFFRYFYLIPNYYFLLFPVIDLQTMRRSYHRRDFHVIAQQGVEWMSRGVIQLILYRLAYNYQIAWSPETMTSFPTLVRNMVLIYLLYLNVSGTFHIIIGTLLLFGYDLPETHRRYLLASSFTDFWRRINIYWKDFMVKIVYFPLYFRLRRSGETRAQVIATATVFLVTWFFHAYQYFWLSGTFLISGPDITFWSILGVLVIVNLLLERQRLLGTSSTTMLGRVRHGLSVVVTLTAIITLWSLWHADSIDEWARTLVAWTRVPN